MADWNRLSHNQRGQQAFRWAKALPAPTTGEIRQRMEQEFSISLDDGFVTEALNRFVRLGYLTRQNDQWMFTGKLAA